MMTMLKSILFFILAGSCEIIGGYLIWMWLRKGFPAAYGVAGAIILVFYGLIATRQELSFARVYATYGGIFIVMSMIWAYYVDGFQPDRYDIVGCLITLLGVSIIYFAPRP